MNFLYNMIMPIEYVFSIICNGIYDIFSSESITIILLGVFVSFFTTPLYRAAERVSAAEREHVTGMEKWVDHIKRNFKGEERVALISYYYKKKNYHHELRFFRELLPLLLQVPFFVAAYHYLINSRLLENADFLWLDDLNRPDGLIMIGGVRLNLLPILMTMVNILSSCIYLQGKTAKEKIQQFITAFVFLILLFKSPSGLVLYWTVNNVFSLFRNLIDRYVPDKKRLYLFFALLPVLTYFWYEAILVGDKRWYYSNNGVFFFLLIFPTAVIWKFFIRWRADVCKSYDPDEGKIGDFILSELSLMLLLGGVIPIRVISASPLDFVNIYDYRDPLTFVAHDISLFLGCGVWIFLIRSINGMKAKRIIQGLLHFCTLLFTMDILLFGKKYGLISEELVYDSLIIPPRDLILSVMMVGGVFIFFMLVKQKRRLWRALGWIVTIASILYCMVKVYDVKKQLRPIVEEGKHAKAAENPEDLEKMIRLSSNDKNICIIMIDRAIGALLPYVMEEKPILYQQLDGFTYYPDTLSFASRTNRASPALFGGYEYMPTAMNARSDELISQKHTEALKLLPTLFTQAGYEVTVADFPYAGRREIPDMVMFNEMPNVKGVLLEGKYNALNPEYKNGISDSVLQRRYFFYSLLRAFPVFVTNIIYDDGNYMLYKGEEETREISFLNAYMELEVLPDITEVRPDISGQLVMLYNNTTHEPCYLQMPDYVPAKSVDNTSFEKNINTFVNDKTMHLETKAQRQHFQINVAALLKLGEFFDYLREEDVYDNTRIIIAADHGEDLAHFDEMLMLDGKLDVEAYNPLLLVKDFNARGFTVSNDFMTNADVPLIALSGIVNEPVNPFTGNLLSDADKRETMAVTAAKSVDYPTGTQFDDGGQPWYCVKNGILDEANWSLWIKE